MAETSFNILCNFVSCFILAFILFQFMNVRYIRIYKNRWIYWGISFFIIIVETAVNSFKVPALNFISWFIFANLTVIFLYYETSLKKIRRIVEANAFLLSLVFEESIFVIICNIILRFMNINTSETLMLTGSGVVVSKVGIIFINYFLLKRFKNRNAYNTGGSEHIAYVVILAFIFLNIMLMVMTMVYMEVYFVFLSLDVFCFLFTDLYLLYYLRTIDEKNHYNEEIKMLNQQAQLQYDYYVQQEQKYNETLHILHDVNRHLKTIKELGMSGNLNETERYTNEIGDLLKPLIPVKYTENAILNILLSDKKRQLRGSGIEISIHVKGVDFGFIDSMDITTIFGNLFDNAIEACEAVKERENRGIVLRAKKVNDMVSITLINDCNPVKWKDGMPVSDKGEGRGIGLLNVKRCVEKYDGSISMREDDGKFVTEFFLNT